MVSPHYAEPFQRFHLLKHRNRIVNSNSDVLGDSGGLLPRCNKHAIEPVRVGFNGAEVCKLGHSFGLLVGAIEGNKLAIAEKHVFHRGNSILAALAVASA